ncbi:MAG: hypothetical protein IJV71_05610 [Lachnospiraceae bacterium]|nr:hypothetical protein [Lachnospiraceae bacterium]
MNLALNIYTDDTLTEVKRTAEAERVKIPYRVAMNIVSSLEGADIDNTNNMIQLISGSTDKLDKIVKATFGVTENELECVDAGELGAVAVELYNWALEKVKSIKGNSSKNA